MPQPLIRSKKSGKRSHKRRSHKRRSHRTRSIRGGWPCISCGTATPNPWYCNRCQAIKQNVDREMAATAAAIRSKNSSTATHDKKKLPVRNKVASKLNKINKLNK